MPPVPEEERRPARSRRVQVAQAGRRASHLPEFESFATGVPPDKAAVLAGLTLP